MEPKSIKLLAPGGLYSRIPGLAVRQESIPAVGEAASIPVKQESFLAVGEAASLPVRQEAILAVAGRRRVWGSSFMDPKSIELFAPGGLDSRILAVREAAVAAGQGNGARSFNGVGGDLPAGSGQHRRGRGRGRLMDEARGPGTESSGRFME